jgi:outer membrane protein OmpA-like peptidoglycan-associated protein
MKRNLFLYLIGLVLIFASCSTYKKGMKSFDAGEYQVAIENFKKVKDNPLADFYVAESYRLSNRIEEAEPYYAQAIQAGIKREEALFYYGYALKTNGKYAEARRQFDEYLAGDALNKEYIQRARTELQNLAQIGEIEKIEPYFKVKLLTELNTPQADYGAVTRDNEVYFTTSRGDDKTYKATGQSFTNLYKAQIGQSMDVVAASIQKLPEMFNTNDRAEGTIAFSPDGNIMVFARGNAKGKKGGQEVNLYVSYFRNGTWSEPQMMRISDPRSWDSTPSFSRNGKTLYFASNRPGGIGGVDLYSARVDARGNFGRVQNLGSEINTAGNDMFPFVSEDNRLYFSSDGHPGLGGLDLFIATRRNGKITIDNLGEPMNSPADDFGLSYFTVDKGYFSSNREGGVGDDDVYAFINSSPDLKIVNYRLVGKTYTLGEAGDTVVLPKTEVRLLDGDRELETTVSDDLGNFRFDLEEGVPLFTLIGDKPNYFTTRRPFDMEGKYLDRKNLTQFRTDTTFTTSLLLDPIVLDKAIVLDNIYYDFDKANIRPDAALELNKLVTILEDNPQLVIELSSHTDNRGDLTYNIDLSQRRAESAVQYIISQGVAANRIAARGYGETRPIIENAETEEEHQTNRRTEFKVTEITPEAEVVRDESPEAVPVEDSPQDNTEDNSNPRKPKRPQRDAVFDELGGG